MVQLLAIFNICCAFAIVQSGKTVTKRFDNDYEQPDQLHVAINSHEGSNILVHAHGGSDKGYSVGSGLRSIAQGSAHQAHSAVANQHAAGIQAAYVAKSTLAQSALQAAATAQAALTGKEVLLQGLERQSIEAHHILESEIIQLQLSKKAAVAAEESAHHASNQVAVITAALNSAEISAKHAEDAANEAAAELGSQQSMVGKAKARLEAIEKQLESAAVDYEATKDATQKASAAAQEAQHNAASAGEHATAELQAVEARSNIAANHNVAYVTVDQVVDNHDHHYHH